MHFNYSGICNVTMFEDALKIFDESMGFPMTDESHDVIKHESYNGEHMSKQSMILNKYLQGVQRIKSNTTTGTRHPKWLNQLIAALDIGAVLSASDISSTQEMDVDDRRQKVFPYIRSRQIMYLFRIDVFQCRLRKCRRGHVD